MDTISQCFQKNVSQDTPMGLSILVDHETESDSLIADSYFIESWGIYKALCKMKQSRRYVFTCR